MLFCHNLCGFFLFLASCLTSLPLQFGTYITPTGNSAAKPKLHIEFEITAPVGRLVFVSNRSGAGKPFQKAPAHQLCILEGWYVLGDRYSPRKVACFWPLHTTVIGATSIIMSRRLSRRILSKDSLAVQAQFVFGTIYNV